jgi:hypothetical protein
MSIPIMNRGVTTAAIRSSASGSGSDLSQYGD